jgi:hypothetical protein
MCMQNTFRCTLHPYAIFPLVCLTKAVDYMRIRIQIKSQMWRERINHYGQSKKGQSALRRALTEGKLTQRRRHARATSTPPRRPRPSSRHAATSDASDMRPRSFFMC